MCPQVESALTPIIICKEDTNEKIHITIITVLLQRINNDGQEKQLTISGHVFDESNESLPGVSVYLKDRAGVGTSTDINGAFKLSAKRRYDYILFYRLQKDGTYRFER